MFLQNFIGFFSVFNLTSVSPPFLVSLLDIHIRLSVYIYRVSILLSATGIITLEKNFFRPHLFEEYPSRFHRVFIDPLHVSTDTPEK